MYPKDVQEKSQVSSLKKFGPTEITQDQRKELEYEGEFINF